MPRGKPAGGIAIPLVALLLSCASPAPPPPAPPDPDPDPDPAAAGPADVAPTEPGFTYCCGNAEFKLEIDCGEMLKRCYQLDGGAWQQTFGRHCKQELGDACYLGGCEQKC